MKSLRFTFLCILTSLLLYSCTKETGVDMESPADIKPIGFTADPFGQSGFTRGTPIGTATGIPNMGVYAYYTGNGAANNWTAQGATATPNFLDGITVSQSGGTWSYINPVYWPYAKDANVTFFAYSPVTTTNNGIVIKNTTGVPTLTYTVPTDCSNQPDLLVAQPKPDLNKNNTGSSPVKFSFHHALTCISFKLAGGGKKVTSIKVKGVQTSGTLSMDGTVINWTDLSETPATAFAAGLSTPGGVTLTEELKDVLSPDGYLLMIPHTLGSQAVIVVSVEGKKDIEFSLANTKWESGKRVNYSITLKSTPILEITIEDWKPGYDAPVNTDPVTEPDIDIGDWDNTGNNETVDY